MHQLTFCSILRSKQSIFYKIKGVVRYDFPLTKRGNTFLFVWTFIFFWKLLKIGRKSTTLVSFLYLSAYNTFLHINNTEEVIVTRNKYKCSNNSNNGNNYLSSKKTNWVLCVCDFRFAHFFFHAVYEILILRSTVQNDI